MRPYDPRLARYAHSTRPYLAVCVALGVISALCVIVQSWLLAHALATLTVPLLLIPVFALRALLVWSQEVAAHRASAGVKAELRGAVLGAAVEGGVKGPTGAVVTLVTRGVDALDPYFSRYLPQLVLATVVPVAILVALLFSDPGTAGIVALTLPLIPMFGILIGTYTAAKTRRQWQTLELLAGHFSDVVSGLTTLKVFGRANAQAREIERISTEHRRTTMASLRIAFCSALVLELAATISVAVVAVSVGLRLVHGNMPFETALFVLILAPEAYLPLRLVGTHFHAAQEGLAAADHIFKTLEPSTATPDRLAQRGPQPGRLAQRGPQVVVRDVLVRDDIGPVNLTLEPGCTALVGPSGAGKSSLLSVLLGFTAPTSGHATLLDRSRIAWLPQHPYLFPATVADNVAIAVPDASPEAVHQAAAATGVLTFTTLDTVLGDNGHGLSAGQRQRIALARIALRCALLNIDLLLLDEPTAHLDIETELDLATTIRTLSESRTTLIVTHRPTLAAHADDIVSWPGSPPQQDIPPQRTAVETHV